MSEISLKRAPISIKSDLDEKFNGCLIKKKCDRRKPLDLKKLSDLDLDFCKMRAIKMGQNLEKESPRS